MDAIDTNFSVALCLLRVIFFNLQNGETTLFSQDGVEDVKESQADNPLSSRN
jgi:hypothetical protein